MVNHLEKKTVAGNTHLVKILGGDGNYHLAQDGGGGSAHCCCHTTINTCASSGVSVIVPLNVDVVIGGTSPHTPPNSDLICGVHACPLLNTSATYLAFGSATAPFANGSASGPPGTGHTTALCYCWSFTYQGCSPGQCGPPGFDKLFGTACLGVDTTTGNWYWVATIVMQFCVGNATGSGDETADYWSGSLGNIGPINSIGSFTLNFDTFTDGGSITSQLIDWPGSITLVAS